MRRLICRIFGHTWRDVDDPQRTLADEKSYIWFRANRCLFCKRWILTPTMQNPEAKRARIEP